MSTPPAIAPHRINRVAASPRARRLMRQLGIEPHQTSGSGPGGRILEGDVRAAAAAQSTQPATVRTATPSVGISVMRRAIAEKTAASFATVPHFYLRVEADVTPLLELREVLIPQVQREAGVKLTLTDFLLRAMARTVTEFPFANQVWRDNSILTLPTVDLGLVVGLPDGLLIPVLRNVDKLSLSALAKLRSEITAAARAGELAATQRQGGAMSLSNLGNSPVDEFAAVIAPGQSSMLAIGRAAPRPFVVRNQLTIRTTLRLCLSADHRVMDGGPAATMLGRLVNLLEHPATLMSNAEVVTA
ncbi:MAG: 2-oxo acid dehydrogenase subunit E2 [Verrucomicrobiota bacterium]